MKHGIFAVMDLKIGTYAQPFFMPTVAAAKRAFLGACSDPSTMLNKHPEDFALYHLGFFDDDDGSLVAVPLENLGLAASYIRKDA